MSPVTMNILAYMAIIAFLGFIAAATWMVMTVLQMVNRVKATAKLIDPPKTSVMLIVSTGKRIAARSTQRFKGIAANCKRAADSVVGVKDDVAEAAGSINVDGVKTGAQETIDNLRNSSKLLKMFEELLQTVQQAGRKPEAG